MTLLEKCNNLAELLESHKSMYIDREKAKALDKRREELVETHYELVRRFARARVFLDGGVLTRGELPRLAAFKERVQSILENFKADPTGITRGRTYTTLTKQTEGLKDKLDKALTKAWEDFFKQHVPTVDNNILDRLKESGQHLQTISNILQLQNFVNKYKVVPPTTQEEFEEFLKQSSALRDNCDTLQGTEVPEDVLAFFRATNSPRGASLSLLTPSVNNWLREKNMLDTFRIRR